MVEVENKWIYPLANKETKKKIKELSKETGLSEVICSIFYNRNFKTAKEIKDFMDISMNDVLPAEGLKDIETCAEIVIKHLKNGNVVIYSDYDADGAFCVIVFIKLMKQLGYNVTYYTNNRKMGYGLKSEGVDELLSKYPKTTLILTSDNGIVAFEGISHAVKDLGIEVCVTDHHEPSPDGKLPECSAIVNPKRLDETYPFKGICGTAVIYKLCQVIYKKLGKNPKVCDKMLDFVGLATVGDVVPLINENRVFVKKALEIINKEDKKIWKLMREYLTDKRYDKVITAKTFGFNYIPAINACSRLLGQMEIPINTFLLDDKLSANEENIKIGIETMKGINEQRKQLSDYQTKTIMNLLKNCLDDPIFVIWAEGLEEGIVGIIAGRICEKFNKPTIIMTNSLENPNIWKGSGRSIPGFNIKGIIDKVQAETNCLKAYGGHEGACGVTLETNKLSEFKVSMIIEAEDLLGATNVKEVIIDFVGTEDDYKDIRLYDEICSLEPYGQEFKMPIFGIKDFNPKNAESFGGEDKLKHLKFSGDYLTYTAWNCGEEWIKDGKFNKKINAIGELGFNDFEKKLELKTREYSDITHN